MSCERALNFDQWKSFSKNYKPTRVWLWFVCKFTENNCHFPRRRGILLPRHNKYPNLKTICHIKPKFFLWPKLPKNLLLAKYPISVAAALNAIHVMSYIRISYKNSTNQISNCTNVLIRFLIRKNVFFSIFVNSIYFKLLPVLIIYLT